MKAKLNSFDVQVHAVKEFIDLATSEGTPRKAF